MGSPARAETPTGTGTRAARGIAPPRWTVKRENAGISLPQAVGLAGPGRPGCTPEGGIKRCHRGERRETTKGGRAGNALGLCMWGNGSRRVPRSGGKKDPVRRRQAMSMAHFSRNHCKPLIKRDDLALPHQRDDGKSVGLARFSEDPAIDLSDRNCGHDQIRSIRDRLLEPVRIRATDEKLNPSRRIHYGRHRSPSRWNVFLRPFRKPLRDLAGRTGMSSIRPSSWMTSTLSPGAMTSLSRTSLGMTI